MDAWPVHFDESEKSTAPQKEKGKEKAQDRKVEGPWRYPVIEHGSLAAATLEKQRDKRYKWIFAADSHREYKVFSSEGPIEVFPPTRPEPVQRPKITALRRAEQGAHFLRTYYPDVDVPAELIREEIAEDDRSTQAVQRNNVASGNAMDIIPCVLNKKPMVYLAFPMGQTNQQLNLSLLAVKAKAKTRINLNATAAVAHTFETPIQQIVASPQTSHILKGKYPLLGVRTVGSTSFIRVKVAASKSSTTAEAVPILSLQRSDVGDRPAVDLSVFHHNNSIGYVATDIGDVYRCGVPEGRRVIERVFASNQSQGGLCRLLACDGGEKIVTTFDGTVFHVDLRDSKRSNVLYTTPHLGAKFTAAEADEGEHILRLVSTQEILWFDDRNARRPLLAVKHGREYDITLRSYTHTLTDVPVTFLTSRTNSLVTIYDVSSQSDNLLRMSGAPYALPPVLRPDGPHLGYAFHQPFTPIGSTCLCVFQLSNRGSVTLLNLDHLPADMAQESNHPTTRANFSEDVQDLADKMDVMDEDLGALAARAFKEADLGSAYQRLFVEREDTSLSAQTNAVFETLESMPRFWKDTDAPVEHVLTTFDVAMRVGAEPLEASRNDWFTGSSLDCVAGYRAWGQERIPRELVRRRSPWHLDISSFVRRNIQDLEEDPQKLLENLACYDLADGPSRTADSFRRESEARSQVALDLSLSTDVYSAHRPSNDTSAQVDDDMLSISLSAQALSLDNAEPPPVQFGFLRPTLQNVARPQDISDDLENSADNSASKELTPLGVRLLLQEWEIGTDPGQYAYHDPYGDSIQAPAPRRPRRSGKDTGEPSTMDTSVPTARTAQRPPVIAPSMPHAPPVIAASQSNVPRRQLGAARSQETFFAQSQRLPNSGSQPTDTWGAPPSSQEPIASTQVLPGPHGGRATAGKKKSAKKRMGGF